MGLRLFFIAITMLAAPSAWASTDLSTGAALSGAFSDEAFEAGARGNPAWLATVLGAHLEPGASAEGSSTDDGAFTLNEALLKAAPAPAKPARLRWVILLIAFSGLTAFFAGKRSGSRGLIAA